MGRRNPIFHIFSPKGSTFLISDLIIACYAAYLTRHYQEAAFIAFGSQSAAGTVKDVKVNDTAVDLKFETFVYASTAKGASCRGPLYPSGAHTWSKLD